MHLGLIYGPFVPHNLMITQDSPVPLPKFQMISRFKILMSSGPKRGTHIDILLFSLKKSWQANPLQVPQWGPYRERYPLTEHFYISLDIALYLKGPKKRVAPMETDDHSRALTYILGSPVKVPYLQVPLMESHWREMPHS